MFYCILKMSVQMIIFALAHLQDHKFDASFQQKFEKQIAHDGLDIASKL